MFEHERTDGDYQRALAEAEAQFRWALQEPSEPSSTHRMDATDPPLAAPGNPALNPTSAQPGVSSPRTRVWRVWSSPGPKGLTFDDVFDDCVAGGALPADVVARIFALATDGLFAMPRAVDAYVRWREALAAPYDPARAPADGCCRTSRGACSRGIR